MVESENAESSIKPATSVTVLLAIVLALAIGSTVGLGAYTFTYAHGASYFSNDPAACANCHVMRDHLDAWVKSSHRSVATCNDCHTPPGFVSKYFTKADHGFFHSLAFTTGAFHEPIQIKERSLRVVEAACRRCHQDVVHQIDTGTTSPLAMSCTRCHVDVGHMN